MTQLFLSHSTSDAHLVEAIDTQLAALGVETYATEHDNRAGANVHDKIKDAIADSDIIAVLLTGGGHDSRYVHQEVGFGLGKDKLVIPIVTMDTKKLDLGMLQGVEYIEVDEHNPTAALDRLVQRVSAWLQEQQQLEEERRQQLKARQDSLLLLGAATVLVLALASGSGA